MKYTFISSVSYGYMLALNANLNTNSYYGTNADFHILYDGSISEDYRKRCIDSFPFKIEWIPKGDFGTGYNRVKYNYAKSLRDQYDAICLIDSDLFICCNTKSQFEQVSNKKYFISAGWPQGTYSDTTPDTVWLPFGEPNKLTTHFGYCFYADFPVFLSPKYCYDLLDYWHTYTANESLLEQHPIVALNRGICALFTPEQLGVLNGHLWVADSMYWNDTFERRTFNEKEILFNIERNSQMFAIHNKWWKHGAANAEFRSLAQGLIYHGMGLDAVSGFKHAENNFNTIVDFIKFFNDMTPETRIEPYFKGRLDAKSQLIGEGLWRDWY
jgi:hypothetical protein